MRAEKSEKLITSCPQCGEDVEYVTGGMPRWFPFCSRRCKLIDLGKWLDEEHTIEDELMDRMPSGGEGEDAGGENGRPGTM
ncbi:MAG: DNA gyrase inhibitor YacG [Planctomycetota bacterium]